jgi:hypothetical protein
MGLLADLVAFCITGSACTDVSDKVRCQRCNWSGNDSETITHKCPRCNCLTEVE